MSSHSMYICHDQLVDGAWVPLSNRVSFFFHDLTHGLGLPLYFLGAHSLSTGIIGLNPSLSFLKL